VAQHLQERIERKLFGKEREIGWPAFESAIEGQADDAPDGQDHENPTTTRIAWVRTCFQNGILCIGHSFAGLGPAVEQEYQPGQDDDRQDVDDCRNGEQSAAYAATPEVGLKTLYEKVARVLSVKPKAWNK